MPHTATAPKKPKKVEEPVRMAPEPGQKDLQDLEQDLKDLEIKTAGDDEEPPLWMLAALIRYKETPSFYY